VGAGSCAGKKPSGYNGVMTRARTMLFVFAVALFGSHAQSQVSLVVAEDAKVTASDAATGQSFGQSVALDGDRVIVGTFAGGGAYVYVLGGNGWMEEQKLGSSATVLPDQLGWSVAIDGDTAVVGAPAGATLYWEEGAAFVYTRNGTTWTEQAQLTAADAESGDLFGFSVAVSGDTVVVGASNDDDAGSNSGSAYVFVRNGTTWTQEAKLTAADADVSDFFGVSAAIESDTILVGASLDNWGGLFHGGSAYVFTRSGTAWTQEAKLTASDAGVGDDFGWSVSLSGDTALVSGHLGNDPEPDSGSAYVFTRSGTIWTEQAKLRVPALVAGDHLGFSVSVDGDIAVLGAIHAHVGGEEQGAAYVFTRNGNAWFEQARLAPGDIGAFDGFGRTVAVDGRRIAVGATGDEQSTGAAFFYSLLDPSYCFCSAAAPCANEDPDAGCTNSTGDGAHLLAGGTTSLSADDLLLTVSGVPRNQFGLLFMGGAQRLVPFGGGQRCIGAGFGALCRFPVQSSGATGVLTEGPGIVAFSGTQAMSCHIDPGETWHFQAWFRDPAGPCGAFFNLSNAASISFGP